MLVKTNDIKKEALGKEPLKVENTSRDKRFSSLKINEVNSKGKRKPYAEKKSQSIRVAEALYSVAEKQAIRMFNCGNFLAFERLNDGTHKIASAGFCKNRLCPLCMWKKSSLHFKQMKEVQEYLGTNAVSNSSRQNYLLLTLTVRNSSDVVSARADLKKLNSGVARFFRSKSLKFVKGYVRLSEVTFNCDSFSNSFKTYHPHVHCIVSVPSSYFSRNSGYYLSHKQIIKLWQETMGLDYEPTVDVREIDLEKNNCAVAEVSKYPIKYGKELETLYITNIDLYDEAIQGLWYVTRSVRMISYAGEFKEARKALKQVDVEQADLIADLETNTLIEHSTGLLDHFQWLGGAYIYTGTSLKDN